MWIAIKEKLSAALCVFLCFLLQYSVFPAFSITKGVPNLILVAVCLHAWLRGEHSAMFCGFFAGLFVDIFFMDTIGLHALIYVYVGFLCGQFHRVFDEHEHRLPLFMILFADLGVLLLRFLLFEVLYGNFHFGSYLLYRMLPELVTTMLSAAVLYPLALWIEMHIVQYTPNKNDSDHFDPGSLADDTGSEGFGG